MFGRIFGGKQSKKGSDFEIVDEDGPEGRLLSTILQL